MGNKPGLQLPAPELGPIMSTSDPTYAESAAFRAGSSVDADWAKKTPCPGFDHLLNDPKALLGRWVRSPSKFVGWDTYMEFFGLKGDKALQETEEPQEHVILGFSPNELRILHRLPWRDGLDCEYTVPLDGSWQPVPPAMVARASSSWKVNDLASWSHAWDHGEDGNPLHRGLRTQQKLTINGTDYALRYWRNLIRPDEMRVNVEVTYAETGKYAVHTQRFFKRIDVCPSFAVASAPSLPLEAATWTHGMRNVRLVLLPAASNMPEGWADLAPAKQTELAEPFPTAGRSCGPYLQSLRDQARDTQLWVCAGVVLKGAEGLLEGVALIGADGWLHGIHARAAASAPYVAGTGDWPATQQARPFGVYDTELGRIAVCADASDGADVFRKMGAQLVLAPPKTFGRATVSLPAVREHANYTRYAVCGPEPEPASGEAPAPLVVKLD